MKIKDLPKVDRPREKLQKYGTKRLINSELLAIMLGSGIKGTNVVELSKNILRKFSGNRLLNVKLEELKEVSGLGSTKASLIIASLELAKRLIIDDKNDQLTVKDIWTDLRDLRNQKKEHFIAYYLDINGGVLEKQTISIGTINTSLAHPRDIFEPAVKLLASSIIVAHNHPSGNINPSCEDIELTKRLAEAGKLMGIDLKDHIIVGSEHFYSFKDSGLL